MGQSKKGRGFTSSPISLSAKSWNLQLDMNIQHTRTLAQNLAFARFSLAPHPHCVHTTTTTLRFGGSFEKQKFISALVERVIGEGRRSNAKGQDDKLGPLLMESEGPCFQDPSVSITKKGLACPQEYTWQGLVGHREDRLMRT